MDEEERQEVLSQAPKITFEIRVKAETNRIDQYGRREWITVSEYESVGFIDPREGTPEAAEHLSESLAVKFKKAFSAALKELL